MMRSWKAQVVHTTGLALPEIFPNRVAQKISGKNKLCWTGITQASLLGKINPIWVTCTTRVYQKATGYEAYHLQLKLASAFTKLFTGRVGCPWVRVSAGEGFGGPWSLEENNLLVNRANLRRTTCMDQITYKGLQRWGSYSILFLCSLIWCPQMCPHALSVPYLTCSMILSWYFQMLSSVDHSVDINAPSNGRSQQTSGIFSSRVTPIGLLNHLSI